LRQSIAGARPFTPIADARRELGLDPTLRTAVMFGSGRNCDRTVVLDAFAQLDGWQLVVAGEVADGLQSDPAGVPRLALPGVVDDEVRALVYSVADLAVLSFVPGYWSESGTLMDAISARIPVVCSSESTAAGIVAELGLGELFAPGDAAALRQAVQHAADGTDPLALDRAYEALSNLTVARQHLESVGVTV
jgi:glycosyltransferase involved in cell wall biosynthesis